MKKPKAEHKLVQAFTPEEVKRLLSLCDGRTTLGVRNSAILMLFLDPGLLSELAGLEISDIDFERGTLLVRKGKGRKQRIVHLGNRCQRALWKWLMIRKSDVGTLFLSDDGQPSQSEVLASGSSGCVRRPMSWGALVSIDSDTPLQFSFLRAGRDAVSLQYLLGHTSLEMTKRYLGSLNADDALKVHKRFTPLDRMMLTHSVGREL